MGRRRCRAALPGCFALCILCNTTCVHGWGWAAAGQGWGCCRCDHNEGRQPFPGEGEAAWRPQSTQALGVGSPGSALPPPSPWITISSRVLVSPRSSGCSQAGQAGGQHIRGLPFSCLGVLVLCRAGGGCPLPGKRAGLCCACVVLGGCCGCAGSVSLQKAGKCVWGPAVTSGGHSLLCWVFYLPCYRRGWVRAHPELCSASRLWKSLR